MRCKHPPERREDFVRIDDVLETANLMFVYAITIAKERTWFASPCFVPDRPVIAVLQLAGLRGLDVPILIPDTPDHLAVYLAAYPYLDECVSTGSGSAQYEDGFLHQ
jgi:cardiolipin synthase